MPGGGGPRRLPPETGDRAIRTALRSFGPLVLLLLLAAGSAPAGDATAARTLFDGGQKAFRTRKYADAAALFQKAWTEDPTLAEAVYWRAQCEEKQKDEPVALASYRQFLALLREKDAATVSAEERKLRDLARKRVKALAVAEREFQALQDRYVASLAAVMKSRMDRGEPDAALQAALRILEVDPANEAALEVRRKLDVSKEPDPFGAVVEWTDLLKDHGFKGDSISYPEGLMVIDARRGGRLKSNPPVRLIGGYGYEVEFRIAEAYDDSWVSGLFFGDSDDFYFSLDAYRTRVELRYGKPAATPEILSSVAQTLEDPSAWHRFGVVVRQRVVEGWLDGKSLFRVPLRDGLDPDGQIGITQGQCRVERRVVRAGRIP